MRTALGILSFVLFLVLSAILVWFMLEGVKLIVGFGLLLMALIAGGLAYG